MQTFIIAKSGERVRIDAQNEFEALSIARHDYDRAPHNRVYDWKDSEYQGEEFNSQLIAEY